MPNLTPSPVERLSDRAEAHARAAAESVLAGDNSGAKTHARLYREAENAAAQVAVEEASWGWRARRVLNNHNAPAEFPIPDHAIVTGEPYAAFYTWLFDLWKAGGVVGEWVGDLYAHQFIVIKHDLECVLTELEAA